LRWGKTGNFEDVREFFLSGFGLAQLQILKKKHFFVYLLKGSVNGIRTHLNLAAKNKRR
jgi:hypothetical protein